MADGTEQQDALLVNLVLMFQSAAMQQMGKISNPLTGKVEKNLDQARFSIDMIEMLKAKTSGNVSPEIGKLLDSTLTNLRLNYVDEAAKKETGETESKPGGTADETTGAASQEEAAAAAGEGRDAKIAAEDSEGGDAPTAGAQAEQGTEEPDGAGDGRAE